MISVQLENLQKYQNQRCLWCLVAVSKGLARQFSLLSIYESDTSRSRGLKYFQRSHKLADTVFFTFEMPIDIYLNGATKYI